MDAMEGMEGMDGMDGMDSIPMLGLCRCLNVPNYTVGLA